MDQDPKTQGPVPVEPGAPDILWIVTTQWRGTALGCAGDANASTPAIDGLAREGICHDATVTPHPFGPFARAALLTGVPSPENGVRDYFDPLPRGSMTIAHRLNDRGYATAWFGKWHLAPRPRDVPLVGEDHARMIVAPEDRGGFSFWEGFEGGFQLNDPWLHGSRLPEPKQVSGYQSDVLCDRAGDWIEAAGRGSRPWFCVVSLEPPHPPYDAAGRGGPEAGEIVLARNVPRGGPVEARARRELAGYCAQIAATDRAIGRLLARRQTGRNTIVVFTSVHGDMHGAHGLFRKGWPHEESVRVPFIVSGLDARAGFNAPGPLSLVNLPAMTLAWADGLAWSSSDRVAKISMPSIVPLADQCDRMWRGIRAGSWKVVFNDDGSPWLAFDLAEDPDEMRNLAADPRGAPLVDAACGMLP